MMNDISISLQAPPSVDPTKQSLQYLIERINEQKGSFRNVTEESLEEEIRSGVDEDTVLTEEVATSNSEEIEDGRSKKEDIYKARDEMLRQISQAQQESAMALDFVSLLLSQRTPGPAGLTLSPFLKQTLPMGSLSAEVVEAPRMTDSEKQNDTMVAMGWRMQSLNIAADSLLESASRLEGEIEREATDWKQILAVKERGWSLSRLPREKHTLGVRYGFAEAYSGFRDKGLAALRPDEEGHLYLDAERRSSINRRLRVRVLQRGFPKSKASGHANSGAQDESLEQTILSARNSIFDEELHHELHREAQHLANQGVQSIENAIVLPYEEDKQIEIQLVSRETLEDEQPTNYDTIPDIIVLFLRILLCQAHQQNLQRRSLPPAPIHKEQRSRPVYAILKPVIEILQHRSHVAALHRLLDEYRKSLTKAGLSLSIDVHSTSQDLTAAALKKEQSTGWRYNVLMDFVTILSSTTFTVHAPEQIPSIVVEMHSTISAPSFGTTYRIQAPLSNNNDVFFSSLADLECEMSHVLQECVKQYIPAAIDAWQGAEVGIEVVSKFNPALLRSETVSVALDRQHFGLIWHSSGALQQRKVWQWYAENSDGETRSLLEVLENIQSI